MATTKLSDGREIRFDFSHVTVREWRELFDRDQPAEQGDAVVGKISGLTVEEIANLTLPDYRRLVRDLMAASQNPETSDPN